MAGSYIATSCAVSCGSFPVGGEFIARCAPYLRQRTLQGRSGERSPPAAQQFNGLKLKLTVSTGGAPAFSAEPAGGKESFIGHNAHLQPTLAHPWQEERDGRQWRESIDLPLGIFSNQHFSSKACNAVVFSSAAPSVRGIGAEVGSQHASLIGGRRAAQISNPWLNDITSFRDTNRNLSLPLTVAFQYRGWVFSWVADSSDVWHLRYIQYSDECSPNYFVTFVLLSATLL